MIFGKKNTTGTPADDGGEFSPEKAKRFFDHAKTVHETGNYEYAIQSWLTGLKFDPQNLSAHQGLFRSIGEFSASAAGKKGLSRETSKPISGKSDVERYLSTLLDWTLAPADASLAVRAAELATKLQLREPTALLAEKALLLGVRDRKPRKEWFLKISQAFRSVDLFDRSIEAAQQASKLDPSDQALANDIKNLAAQAAMQKGKYGTTGEGGFRQSVRDSDKQRMLEESERVVKTDETRDRIIADAEADLASRPSDYPAIDKLARLLVERGQPADLDRAYDLYMKGYTESHQFRMRQLAGEIQIRKVRRRISDAKKALEGRPNDPTLLEELSKAESDHRELEISELRLQIKNYPTNVQLKYELGRRLVGAGHFDEAIPTLQEAQNDPKYRGHVMNYLGQAFLKIDYASEAVEMFRKGLEMRELSDELSLELQYGLMTALQSKAEADRDLTAADEADKVASQITIKQFNYRDVRQRRDAIKKLIASLRGGPAV